MIVSILLIILFIIVAAAFLFFLFNILFTSLRAEKINASDPLFSKEEIEENTSHPKFTHIDTGMKAVVLCSPERSFRDKRFTYKGQRDCTLFKSIYTTEYDCSWGCTGFGNCVYACPRQAITIENETAVVNSMCNGCGLCVSICPKQLIVLIPADQKTCVLCKAPQEEKNGCSMCRKESKVNITTKKHFIFWEKCYKILHRK